MVLVVLKKVIEDLEKLKISHHELRMLISDQVKDCQIDKAKDNLEKLEKLELSIQQMENLKVQI